MPETIKLKSIVERKSARLPSYVVIPSTNLIPWRLSGTTVVQLTLNGCELGRRTIKRWDEKRWFMELTQPQCTVAGIEIGDSISLKMVKASEAFPNELGTLIAKDAIARRKWESLTPGSKRMLREHILGGKQPATRLRRAVKALKGIHR